MVKTLLKYEFKTRYKLPALMSLILLGIAGAVRLLSAFRVDSIIYSVIYNSSVFFFIVGCIALISVTVILNIVRFYKNLYSSEGYLSFTLPVTEHQHIFVKTLVSFTLLAGAAVVVFLAALLAAETNFMKWFFGQLDVLIRGLINDCGTTNFVFYVIETVAVAVVYTLCSIMKYHACLSIGQLAKRRKVLLSVGVFAALYAVRQLLGTMFIIVNMQIALSGENLIVRIGRWMTEHYAQSVHIILCLILVYYLIGTVLFYLATYLPMKKKLNLE